MQPRSLLGSLASQAPITPTSGSTGPAGSMMSGFPCPGCVKVRPLRILKRRLKATVSSLPFPTPAFASTRRSWASATASTRAFSTWARYLGSTHVDSS